MTYQTNIDIANRTAQILGVPRITTLNDQSMLASEFGAAYYRLRDDELARNLWTFATRRAALRALDTTSTILTFETWSASYTYVDGSTGYPAGYVVQSSDGLLWVSLVNGNTQAPGTAGTQGVPQLWDSYFGTVTANAWNDSIQNTIPTNNIAYHLGEIVYLLSNDRFYVSIVEGNQNEPDIVDTWSATTMYRNKAVVSQGGTNYQSIANLNFGNQPPNGSWWTTVITQPTVSGSWIQLSGATASQYPIIYPVTAGPSSDPLTANAYKKPAGWLREAPQSPKAGALAFLGAHVGLPYSDVVSEGGYLVSWQQTTAMIYRFVARITDVTQMDRMFCEGLAGRAAKELAPTLNEKRERAAIAAYNTTMSEARTVNAIEAGPVEQDEDEIISVRL